MSQLKLTIFALLVEISAALQLLASGSHSDLLLVSFLITHMIASAALATLALLVMPPAFSSPRRASWLFIFCLSTCIPVLGLVGVLLALTGLPLLPAANERFHFRSVRLPELDPHDHKAAESFRQAGLRQFLRNDRAPVDQRLRALVGLQNAPARFASPLLRDLLAASSEDLRLLAYGMLETREKHLNAEIHNWRVTLQAATAKGDDSARRAASRRLSALYWEMIYQELVQGDLRRHAAMESLRFLEASLDEAEAGASLHLRHGRLLQEIGRDEAAAQAYRAAITKGLPAPRVQPYLAELAFARRDFSEVRRLLASLHDYPDQRRLAPIVKFWSRA